MWQSGYPTAGLFMIHSNVMKDGKVVGWSVSHLCPAVLAAHPCWLGSRQCPGRLPSHGMLYCAVCHAPAHRLPAASAWATPSYSCLLTVLTPVAYASCPRPASPARRRCPARRALAPRCATRSTPRPGPPPASAASGPAAGRSWARRASREATTTSAQVGMPALLAELAVFPNQNAGACAVPAMTANLLC